MAGYVPPGVPVLLAASPAQNVLVTHPASAVAQVLIEHHARLVGGEHG